MCRIMILDKQFIRSLLFIPLMFTTCEQWSLGLAVSAWVPPLPSTQQHAMLMANSQMAFLIQSHSMQSSVWVAGFLAQGLTVTSSHIICVIKLATLLIFFNDPNGNSWYLQDSEGQDGDFTYCCKKGCLLAHPAWSWKRWRWRWFKTPQKFSTY